VKENLKDSRTTQSMERKRRKFINMCKKIGKIKINEG